MVGWEKVAQPTRRGGLGVRLARSQNISLLGKLIWELIHNPEKLWVQVFRGKYLQEGNIFYAQGWKGSSTWNGMMKALKLLEDGFRLKVGNGDTSFWFEPWLFKVPLSLLVPFVDVHDLEMRIWDVWVDGSWQLNSLYTHLPDEIRGALLQLAPLLYV